jgi:guanylate kinase
MVAAGSFFEWSHIYQHRYGKLWTELLPPLLRGRRVVLELHPDTVHHYAVRLPVPLVALYLEPPSLACLKIRLDDRVANSQCDQTQAKLRLAAAGQELARLADPEHRAFFDAVLVSGDGPGGAYVLDRVISEVRQFCAKLVGR